MSSTKTKQAASEPCLVDEVDLLFVRVSSSEYEPMEDTSNDVFSRVMETDMMVTRIDRDGTHEVENVWPSLKARIQRFMRRRDGYIALVSLLLKSQAYYQARSKTDIDATDPTGACILAESHRPIVDLPRTSHNKPFVPRQHQLNTLSVSHQAPFVGMARLGVCSASASKSQANSTASSGTSSAASEQIGSCQLSIGFDIVVFEKLNTKLYSSVDSFLGVFRSSFASTEWSQLLDSPNRIYEFYIRWSMKEAYTKALGLGMSYSFDQFQIELDCISTASVDTDSSIWSWIGTQQPNSAYAVSHGTVRRQNLNRKEDNTGRLIAVTESWLFLFRLLPLTAESSTVSGCACACVGPLDDEDSEHGKLEVKIQENWTNVQELFQFHGMDIGTNP